ncbi:hypothetical protein Bcav_0693 [Beutenbergia cavernae DSM 12333]|uniref:Uncharacterized protein n=1 Tax=Beutenbergia cavernae (strain ATCC BAA-8 / DSM 12333 / CCUG 43141 / JCM 11478 / NBRC 16432 / NCIMB 13614 / HKI 0122) TaxID=471853 RepID=C5BYJ6_BEUC1|nr:hypothetical protein Bcav_0693 [Beutenbergia cavernae DSM 12333]
MPGGSTWRVPRQGGGRVHVGSAAPSMGLPRGLCASAPNVRVSDTFGRTWLAEYGRDADADQFVG